MKRWMLVLVAVVGCKNAPSEDQCKQLLDHLIDLEFKQGGANASSDAVKAELAKEKQALVDGKTNEFVEMCTKKMPRARAECALSAGDLKGVASCDDAK